MQIRAFMDRLRRYEREADKLDESGADQFLEKLKELIEANKQLASRVCSQAVLQKIISKFPDGKADEITKIFLGSTKKRAGKIRAGESLEDPGMLDGEVIKRHDISPIQTQPTLVEQLSRRDEKTDRLHHRMLKVAVSLLKSCSKPMRRIQILPAINSIVHTIKGKAQEILIKLLQSPLPPFPAEGPNDDAFRRLTSNLIREGKGWSLEKSLRGLDVDRFMEEYRVKHLAQLRSDYGRDGLTNIALKACQEGYLSVEEVATISLIASFIHQLCVYPVFCLFVSSPVPASPSDPIRFGCGIGPVPAEMPKREILNDVSRYGSLKRVESSVIFSDEAKHYLLPILGIQNGTPQAQQLLEGILKLNYPFETFFTVFSVLDGDVSLWSPMLKRLTEVFKQFSGKDIFAPVRDINCKCSDPYFPSFHCTRFVVPSASILQIWFKIMCGPEAPGLRWVFGKVTHDDIQKSALLNERPIQLYHWLSLLEYTPDSYYAGDGIFSLHDIYHAIRLGMQSLGTRDMYQLWAHILKSQPEGEKHAVRIGDGQLAMDNPCTINTVAHPNLCGQVFHQPSDSMPEHLRVALLRHWSQHIAEYKETFGVDIERNLCVDCVKIVKETIAPE